MSQASVHEQAYHLLINTALTYQQIADELKSGQHRHIHAILKKVQRLSAYEDIGQRPAWVDLLFKYCLLMMI